MLDFWIIHSHVDEDVLKRAAERTRNTLEGMNTHAPDWWQARGVWRIDNDHCAWASAWEIESYYCVSSTEAVTFYDMRVKSEKHCERVFNAMLAMEQAADVVQMKAFGLVV